MNRKNNEPLHIFSRWCKKCGICVSICPKNVLEMEPNGYPFAARPEDCIQCGLCDMHCPDYAITLLKKEDKHEKAR